MHVDVKKFGRIPYAGGGAPSGPYIGDRHRDRHRLDYVHSMIDDHVRRAYCDVLPDEKGPTCAGLLSKCPTTVLDLLMLSVAVFGPCGDQGRT